MDGKSAEESGESFVDPHLGKWYNNKKRREIFYEAESNPVGSDAIKTEDHSSYTMVSCCGNKFRFGEEGNLEFVKLMFGENENKLMNMLIEAYGEYDDANEDMGFYYWYGTLNGKNTKLVLCIDPISEASNHIQLSPENKLF